MSRSSTQWRYADDNARRLLGEDPLVLFAQPECVKSNPVRQVLHVPGLYLKLDKRPGHSFEGEFRAAQFVSSCGIPAVPHLACGIHEGSAALITQEAADTCDLIALSGSPAEPALLENFARFTGLILRSPIFHPDFHLGNILCRKKTQEFLLIDLHGIRRRTLFDRLFAMHRMYRIILEWREGLSDARLTELLTIAGVPHASTFLPLQLKREAAHLKHEFPRRARQILSGYAKFTRISGSGLLCSEVAVPGAETGCPESEKLLLLHFFLKLARIPHTGIDGVTPGGKAFYQGAESPFRLSPEELKKRLSYYHLEVPDGLLLPGSLTDLRSVLEYNRKVFSNYV